MGNIGSKALMFLFVVLITRALTVEEFGQLTVARTFVQMFSVVVGFGMSNLIVRKVSRDPTRTGIVFTSAISIRSILALLSIGVLSQLPSLIGHSGIVASAVVLLSLTLLFDPINAVLVSLYQAYEKMHYEALLLVVHSFSLLAGAIISLKFGLGVKEICLFILIASMTRTTISLVCSRRVLGHSILSEVEKVSIRTLREFLSEASVFLPIAVFEVLYHRVDILILSWMMGNSAVGLYGVAYSLFEAALVLPMVVGSASFPEIIRNGKGTDRDFSEVRKILEFLFMSAFHTVVLVILESHSIIHLIFGERYLESARILSILICGIYLQSINNIFGRIIYSLDGERRFLRISSMALLTNCVFNILLIPYFGTTGAALATIISFLVSSSMQIHYVKQMATAPSIVSASLKPCIAGVSIIPFLLVIPDSMFATKLLVTFPTWLIVAWLLGMIPLREIKKKHSQPVNMIGIS